MAAGVIAVMVTGAMVLSFALGLAYKVCIGVWGLLF